MNNYYWYLIFLPYLLSINILDYSFFLLTFVLFQSENCLVTVSIICQPHQLSTNIANFTIHSKTISRFIKDTRTESYTYSSPKSNVSYDIVPLAVSCVDQWEQWKCSEMFIYTNRIKSRNTCFFAVPLLSPIKLETRNYKICSISFCGSKIIR
jgi:hypothetical protein